MAEENKDKKDIEDEEDTLSPEDIDSEMSKAMNDDREEEEEKVSKVKGKGLEGVAEGIQGGLEDAPLDDQVKTSFLDYAMSTITARALPDVRDGLKPVTRRIIYGMATMGMWPDKPFKKSARIVGDVMGKYHPHGDSSIYEAMARLAQDFAVRYMLVQGHGNYGSQDGDDPAAYRYTEARLNKLSLQMVRDMYKNTVDFVDTYDGDGQEPVVLPARIPNLIINGSQGIAVGMTTNIPSHNLRETFNAIIALMKNPSLEPVDLMEYIKGPDFPGGGIICGRSGIKHYFETGSGNVKVRGRYHLEQTKDGRTSIVFTEVPYMVNKKLLAKSIMELCANKTLEDIQSIADYSDEKTGTKFTIELKRNANVDIVLNHLFKYTKLQSSFPVNMLALDRGTPRVLNMKQALELYIEFQREVVRRRTVFDLDKAKARNHILDGLIEACDNVDEVVSLIRGSKTQEEASIKLKERFNFDDEQVKAILDMTLRKLTGLERDKLSDEKAGHEKDMLEYNHILSDAAYLDSVLMKEMQEISDKFGDDRRTEISDIVTSEEDEDLIADKSILIALTKNGYIKRMSPDEFKMQNRGGIGVAGMTTKDNDEVSILTLSRTKRDVLFFTSVGKVYRVRGYQIPEGSRTSKGIPVINFLSLAKDESVLEILSVDAHDQKYLVFVTDNGIIKKTSVEEYEYINKAGKIALNVREGDELFSVKATDGSAKILIGTSNGKICMFDESDVRSMGRTATGVKGVNLDGGKVVGLATSKEGNMVLTVSSKGIAKLTPIDEYRETSRGAKGVKTLKESDRTGGLVTMGVVHGDEQILIITDGGTLMRTSLTQLPTHGRYTSGVKLVTLRDNENIASISILPSDESIDTSAKESDEKAAKEEEQEESENKIDAALTEMLHRSEGDGGSDEGSGEDDDI